jgi:hypothetical protein
MMAQTSLPGQLCVNVSSGQGLWVVPGSRGDFHSLSAMPAVGK